MGDVHVLHRLTDLLEEFESRLPVAPHEDRHELLPAVPGEQVRGPPEVGGNLLGYGRNDPVPRRVAEGVVIDLELVNIEHAQGEGLSETDSVLPSGGALRLVAPAVGHAGELIHQGLLLELVLIAVELDVGVDPGLDDHRAEGLGDIVHRPQQEPPLLVLNVGQAGDHDDGDVPGQVRGFQLPDQGEPVHVRHHHVQQDQGIAPLLGGAEPVRCGLAHGDLVIVFQDRVKKLDLYGAVVNDQYPIHEVPPWVSSYLSAAVQKGP